MKSTSHVRFRLFTIALLISSTNLALPNLSPKEKLAQSAAFFDKGEYRRALDGLEDIEIRADFDSSEDMLIAFKIKSICYSKLNEINKASETIRELFFLDQKYKFDPFDTPASTIALAQIERKKIEEKSALLATAKNGLPPLSPVLPELPQEHFPIEKKVYVEKKPHILLAIAPFGINHFVLDSPTKGTIYAITQLVSLTANIGSFWFKQNYLTSWGSSSLKNPDDTLKFERAQASQYTALGGLFLSYVISVIDALITLSKTNTQNLATGETTS